MNQNLHTQVNSKSIIEVCPIQTRFPSPNPQKFKRPIQRISFGTRVSVKSPNKKQYLTLVSKEKKPRKRLTLKTSHNDRPKKIRPVILGGEKTTNCSFTNTQKSLRSSLCRSCTSLQQKVQIVTKSTPKTTIINFQSYIHPVPIIMKSRYPIIIQNTKTDQLNKIISQKLNLESSTQNQGRISFNGNAFKAPQNNNEASNKFGGKLIRNAASTGRIYFSVGGSRQKLQQVVQETTKAISTPKFDKESPQKLQKRRKNAGFIRSASAPKITFDSTEKPGLNEEATAYQMSNDKSKKHEQISKCLEKMSSIRKQIDQLQIFLQDRLLNSQLKNKYLYNPSSSCMKDRQIHQDEVSFSTIPIESKLEQKDNLYTPINSIILEKSYQTNSNKCPLMQVNSSSLNASAVTSKLGHNYSLTQQFQPFSSIQNLSQQKFPSSNFSSNIQKQILSQMSSTFKNHISNKENCFYTSSLHSIR